MICTTNIAPTYLCTTTIAQQSASVVQVVSGLPSILLLARNRRLNLFAFVNELINDPDALVTSCRIHLDCYVFFKKWQQTCFSREGHKNERYKGSRFTERNRIHSSQLKLPLRTIHCIIQLYAFLIESILEVGPGPSSVK